VDDIEFLTGLTDLMQAAYDRDLPPGAVMSGVVVLALYQDPRGKVELHADHVGVSPYTVEGILRSALRRIADDADGWDE